MRATPVLLALLAAVALLTLGNAVAAPGTNGRIVFVSERDGNLEIYTAAPDGSDVKRLTANTVADRDPAWSFDGTKIAFTRGFDIWVMNADGSDQHSITDATGPDSEPAWSPDGTQLVFISNRNTPSGNTTGPELFVMNSDGTGIRQVTDTPASASLAPAWSPVGNQLAFHSNVDGEFELYTISASSTAPGTGTDSRVKLTNNNLQEENAAWSPEGTQILFERGTGTNYGDSTKEIWVTTANGSNQVQLTTNTDYDIQPTWSPDGTRIAYASDADGDLEIVSMPVGGAATNLTNTAAGIDDDQPDWGVGPAASPTPTPTLSPTPTATETPPESRPPVIFIHGFLGASIGCPVDPKGNTKGEIRELWPNIRLENRPGSVRLTAPDFDRMRLASDGVTNRPGDACNRDAYVTGLVEEVLGSDIYAGMVRNLQGMGRRHYIYTYDWRQSPGRALAGLDALIERARTESGAAKVTLVAHSMGGLVTRWYIDDPARAAKVTRALTIGTPYWGSAKAWLPLVRGLESQGFSRFNPLDVIIHDPEAMKRWAQNLTGLYFLYPSANWYRTRGSWLSFEDEYGGRALDFAGVVNAIASQSGNPTLARLAYKSHADHLDSFKTNGVDFRAVVGTGVETVTKMREHRKAWIPFTDYIYGDGDGTVPTFSGMQQLNSSAPVLGEPIQRHFVCGIDHNALATDVKLFAGIEGFLLHGSPITLAPATSNGEHDQRGFCGRASTGGGREIIIYGDGTRGPGLPDIDVDPEAGASGAAQVSQAGSGPMKLHEAAGAGLIDVIERGERTVLVARGDRPVALRVTGRNLAVQVTPLLADEREGRPVGFEAPRGTLVLNGMTAKLKGRRLRASRPDRTPPRTTVKLRRRGRITVLTPKARDRSGVRSTFIQIGRGKPRPFRRAHRVPTRKLRSVRFGSVDVFGNAEAPRRIRR